MLMRKHLSFLLSFLLLSSVLYLYPLNNTAKADEPWTSTWTPFQTTDFEAVSGEDYGQCFLSDTELLPNGSTFLLITAGGPGDGSSSDYFYGYLTGSGPSVSGPYMLVENHEDTADVEAPVGCRCCIDSTGRLWVSVTLLPSGPSFNYMVYSDDYGVTWTGINETTNLVDSEAVNITTICHSGPGTRTWLIGNGVQTTEGRIIFNGYSYTDYTHSNQFTVYCDDPVNGSSSTWHWGGEYGQGQEYSESSFIQLDNESLYMTIRDGSVKRRHYAYCLDETASLVAWEESGGADQFPYHDTLYDPEVGGYVARLTSNTTEDYNKSRVVLIWNNNSGARDDLTVAVSYDECKTWVHRKEINDWEYGFIFITGNKTIITTNKYSSNFTANFKFTQFNIEWLTDSADSLNYLGSDPSTEISFHSINGQNNNTNLQDSNRTFVYPIVNNTDHYDIRVGNSTHGSNVTEVFLQLDNINLTNYPSHYSENSTHVTFIIPDQYNITFYGYHYYQVRAYT